MNIFKNSPTLIADAFAILWIPKNVVRSISKKLRFRGTFHKQHSKRDEAVLKSEWDHFYQIYWSLWRQFSSKKSLLVIRKFLGLFFNILPADHRYSLLNRDNWTQPILMKLPIIGKIFSFFYLHFWNADKILKFLKKDNPHSWSILEVTDFENRHQIKVLNVPFLKTLRDAA